MAGVKPLTALERLASLSLVSKLCSVLDSALGVSDKTLAEFIIDLAESNLSSTSPPPFGTTLAENGAEFPHDVVDKILNLVRRDSPKLARLKKASSSSSSSALDNTSAGKEIRIPRSKQEALYPGLTVKNSAPLQLDDDFKERSVEEVQKSKQQQHAGDTAGPTSDTGRRELSNLPSWMTADDSATASSSSNSNSNSSTKRKRDDSSSINNNSSSSSDPNALTLHGIYDGTVTKIMDFGCFVQINNKSEGLVHISQISNAKIDNPSSVLKRNQPCKVKIISLTGARMALSIKEVDQKTGEDLFTIRSRQYEAEVS